jgi:hypothetical protein
MPSETCPCPHCHAECPPNAAACPYCGSRFVAYGQRMGLGAWACLGVASVGCALASIGLVILFLAIVGKIIAQ